MLIDIILDLLQLRQSPPSLADEGSSTGMQAIGIAMLAFGGLAMLVAILAMAHG